MMPYAYGSMLILHDQSVAAISNMEILTGRSGDSYNREMVKLRKDAIP